MIKRKLWIYSDINVNFRNMYSIINYLKSLPIIKYTLKRNYKDNSNKDNSNKDNSINIKLTKKNITIY